MAAWHQAAISKMAIINAPPSASHRNNQLSNNGMAARWRMWHQHHQLMTA